MEASMNVNVQALRDSLDLRVVKGRTPIEAAGEERWIARVERDLGVIANQTVSEREQLIEEWLAEQPGMDIEKAKIVVLGVTYFCCVWRQASSAGSIFNVTAGSLISSSLLR